MNITKALSIDGWMKDAELTCLAEFAAKSLNIAEIGSWMGRSTAALAANTTGTVHAIDTWEGSGEAAHIAKLAGRSHDWLLNIFKKNEITSFSLIFEETEGFVFLLNYWGVFHKTPVCYKDLNSLLYYEL